MSAQAADAQAPNAEAANAQVAYARTRYAETVNARTRYAEAANSQAADARTRYAETADAQASNARTRDAQAQDAPPCDILSITHLSKAYSKNEKKALTDVSMTVKSGEFISIIGSSGAGKSTLLRCINRMVDATEGEIVFNGHNITQVKGKALRRVRTNIGMIFQNYNLVERLSALENVLHGRLGHKSTLGGALGLYTEAEKEQAFDILETLGLTEFAYKRCDELSGGQKQRVGIARALMQSPALILCDEPIASLDPNSSKVIMDYLREINRKMNITCLVNLHQVDFALAYAERIIGINSGRIVYDGSSKAVSDRNLSEIYNSPKVDPAGNPLPRPHEPRRQNPPVGVEAIVRAEKLAFAHE